MPDIILEHIHKSFGQKIVLRDLNCTFPTGRATAIMGPSGCGKTTLLNILLGFERCDKGSIKNKPHTISVVFQEDRLCEGFTAMANVRLTAGKKRDGEIRECLAALGLEPDAAEKKAAELSGGMKRRIAIARALMAPFDLLVLDEPFKGLDVNSREETAAAIRRYAEGKTVILVTHDSYEAKLLNAAVFEMQLN